MSKLYEKIDETLCDWINRQKVFFVATAPLARESHINCSPKGGDSFRILDPLTVAYQDLTGSGIETVAHLKENGRIVIIFCAFEGDPKILRLHGLGEVLTKTHPEFGSIANRFPPHDGTRCVIRVRLNRISDSCGFGVPIYEFRKRRSKLDKWAESRGRQQLEEYREKHNRESIDGLRGLP